MSNENKTALTAEEILKKHSENSAKCEVIYNKTHDAIIDAMQEFASLKTKEKDKLIKANDIAFKDSVKRNQQTIKLLQSTIESQQKEIEELKTSIEGVFGWREKNHHLTISEKQLKSQLSEVTKERDEAVRNAFNESRLTHPMVGFKHDTFEDYLKSLTPTKE